MVVYLCEYNIPSWPVSIFCRPIGLFTDTAIWHEWSNEKWYIPLLGSRAYYRHDRGHSFCFNRSFGTKEKQPQKSQYVFYTCPDIDPCGCAMAIPRNCWKAFTSRYVILNALHIIFPFATAAGFFYLAGLIKSVTSFYRTGNQSLIVSMQVV